MPRVKEGRLSFKFPSDWEVTKLDEWTFYRAQFAGCCGGAKAVDILAIHRKTAWLIEVKDYRIYPRTKIVELPMEVAVKVRDSLSLLVAASLPHNNHAEERRLARQALRVDTVRVVLHIEQPQTPSKLRPQVVNPADLKQKLKQLLRAIDPHPKVVGMTGKVNVPWNTFDLPQR